MYNTELCTYISICTLNWRPLHPLCSWVWLRAWCSVPLTSRAARPTTMKRSAVPHVSHNDRTAPHCTAPHRAVPHCTAPQHTAPHRTAPHRTAPHRTAPHPAGCNSLSQHCRSAPDARLTEWLCCRCLSKHSLNYHSAIAPYSSLSQYCSYQKNKRFDPGKFRCQGA
jgi:hypothetical protein